MSEYVNANLYMRDPRYYHYLVQYQGDIENDILKYPDLHIKLINDKYAILFIPKDKISMIDDGLDIPSIVFVKLPEMYTLQEISPIEASQVDFLQLNLPLTLTGKGTTVAIIDTGIDYLNEEFMDSSGNTRIKYLWDQSIEPPQGSEPDNVPYGTIYSREQIQNAINESRNGGDPYKIVPSTDTNGHGTAMAGIVGARGKNPEIKGIVPECDFIIIKLFEDVSFTDVYKPSVPVYNITAMFSSLEFIFQYYLKLTEPIIALMPLGSNLGSHNGDSIIDEFIEYISITTQVCIVTCAGNERVTGAHVSGNLNENEANKIIDLDIPPEEKNLWVDIWAPTPNIISVDVISPSGENSGVINTMINKTAYYKYIFEKTYVKVNYYIPEEITGDELIRLRFYDLQPGIWRLRITGELIVDGQYNLWIPQKGIINEKTHFTPYDIYNTVTNPGNGDYTITVAAYNQNNNNIVNYSGISANGKNIIDVAAGGVNALTTAPGNKVTTVNGTSVASAVVAGACAMLIEWGVNGKNNPYIRAKTMKNYLAIGVATRSGDIYPNAEWGYGMLNILNLFQNLY